VRVEKDCNPPPMSVYSPFQTNFQPIAIAPKTRRLL